MSRIRMEPEKYYHVYNRGINRESIFKEPKNYQYFLDRYYHYLNGSVNTLCYCLMPTHFHLFIRVKPDVKNEQVIKSFKNFFISCAKSINKSYHRTGSLFQSKFKKKEVDSDSYFSTIIAYLNLNPVRAGVVPSPESWKHSSYNFIVNNDQTSICKDEVLDWFGGLDAFLKLHDSFHSEKKTLTKLF